jgi:hypothetical protein
LREDVLPFTSESHKISPVENSLGTEVSTKVPATSVRTQGPPSWFRRDWLLGLILIFFVLLAYTPVWKAGFVWDDEIMLTANPCIVGPLGLKEIWTTSAADICPLTLTTFWAEHALWGLHPLPYHFVNVLIHGLSAVLLWRVLRSLRIQGAWLGAALWALHPVAVESVAWITEMKNTESVLFFLLSILFLCQVDQFRGRGVQFKAGTCWEFQHSNTPRPQRFRVGGSGRAVLHHPGFEHEHEQEHDIPQEMPRRTNRRRMELYLKLAFCRFGDGCQVFCGDSAGCSLLMRLVDRGPVALAQHSESGPRLSHGNRCQCLIDVDARVATRDRPRSTMDTALAGAPGDSR